MKGGKVASLTGWIRVRRLPAYYRYFIRSQDIQLMDCYSRVGLFMANHVGFRMLRSVIQPPGNVCLTPPHSETRQSFNLADMDSGAWTKALALPDILFPESPLAHGTRSACQSDRHILAYQSPAPRLILHSPNEMWTECIFLSTSE